MDENTLARNVVDICYHLHRQYGPGLFESVYEELICYELSKRGIPYQRQYKFRVVHEGIDMGVGFKADLVVGEKLIVELKSVEHLHEVFYKQVTTYLKISGLKLGLLVNFKVSLIKDGLHRIANGI